MKGMSIAFINTAGTKLKALNVISESLVIGLGAFLLIIFLEWQGLNYIKCITGGSYFSKFVPSKSICIKVVKEIQKQ